jgi:hypothetical protein
VGAGLPVRVRASPLPARALEINSGAARLYSGRTPKSLAFATACVRLCTRIGRSMCLQANDTNRRGDPYTG